jgi:hypothetical protein
MLPQTSFRHCRHGPRAPEGDNLTEDDKPGEGLARSLSAWIDGDARLRCVGPYDEQPSRLRAWIETED